MAELLCRIYVRQPKAPDAKLLRTLFDGESANQFIEISEALNPDHGKKLAIAFLEQEERLEELQVERYRNIASFAVWQLILGLGGPSIVEETVTFLNELLSGSGAWAYLRGDDDPWEIWYKIENGQLILEEVDATAEESRKEVVDTIYAWWHSGLPRSICEGYWVESRDQIPKPKISEKLVATTKVTMKDDEVWESIYFGMSESEGQDPDWPDPTEEHQDAIRLLKLFPTTERLNQVQMERLDGSYGYINYNFSTPSTATIHHLNYAALCVAADCQIKKFEVVHPDHQLHFLRQGNTIRVEKRRGRAKLEVTDYDVGQILEMIDQAVLDASPAQRPGQKR